MGKQHPGSGAGVGEELKEFHFHRPPLLGSPQSGVRTGLCPQEGLGPD